MVGNDSSVKGGITSVISQILSHDWAKDDIDMRFIPTYIEANNFKKILFFVNAYRKIKKEIKRNRPNVVHIHMSYKGSFTRKYLIHKLCKKHNIPDIIHLHGSEFKKWYDEVDDKKKEEIKTLLREANAFVVLGEKWNQAIKGIEPSTNTVVVSNTVHIPEETVKWAEPFKILFLGVLIKRKGVHDLLKAVKLLKDDLGTKKFKVIIAGTGTEEEKLKDQARELGIDNVVDFIGWTDGNRKTKLLRECQLLVLPSYNEGLPVSILEAMSYGMPIIAADVGDIPSAITTEKNGYLINPGDYHDLSKKLESIIENPKLYIYLSNNSKKLAEMKYSDKEYFQSFSRLYKKLFASSSEITGN